MENLYGALISPKDSRDYQAKDYISSGVRPVEYMPDVLCPVHRQQSGDCTAWSVATAKFYHELRERKSQYEFAPIFSYFDRTNDDYTGSGRYMRKVLSNLLKNGICYAKDLPKGVPLSADYPNETITQELLPLWDKAKENKIKAYAFTNDMNEVADCVFQHGSATLTINVYSSFDAFVLKSKDNWVLPIPKDEERIRGCHEICAMGLTKDGVVIQNSWGDNWGCNGFAVVPWDYPILEGWTLVDEKKDWDIIEIGIDENLAKFNDKYVYLDVPAQIINNRTMIPLRVVSELLGCDVEWINSDRKVIVRRTK